MNLGERLMEILDRAPTGMTVEAVASALVKDMEWEIKLTLDDLVRAERLDATPGPDIYKSVYSARPLNRRI